MSNPQHPLCGHTLNDDDDYYDDDCAEDEKNEQGILVLALLVRCLLVGLAVFLKLAVAGIRAKLPRDGGAEEDSLSKSLTCRNSLRARQLDNRPNSTSLT